MTKVRRLAGEEALFGQPTYLPRPTALYRAKLSERDRTLVVER